MTSLLSLKLLVRCFEGLGLFGSWAGPGGAPLCPGVWVDPWVLEAGPLHSASSFPRGVCLCWVGCTGSQISTRGVGIRIQSPGGCFEFL